MKSYNRYINVIAARLPGFAFCNAEIRFMVFVIDGQRLKSFQDGFDAGRCRCGLGQPVLRPSGGGPSVGWIRLQLVGVAGIRFLPPRHRDTGHA